MVAQPGRDEEGFGTFAGVFRPILLTILGAMLYLREGWLVGNNGLLGALFVIGAAFAITGTTAMSLSTIATNVRVSRGGPFAIVARALGLEAGGAIGVPLFIAQAISSVMYLYAFSEAWAVVFPEHDGRLVAAGGFAVVAVLALVSASLAARAQKWMLLVVAVALVTAFGGLFTAPEWHQPVWVGRFESTGLLGSFAIFFPAATGIMVGAGMSGELADPRRALPRGTLGAWAVTGLVYAIFAVWYSLVATPAELLGNKTLILERSLVGNVVLVGLLASTLMAALSSMVAAPRLLQAMAEYEIVPGSRWLGRTTASGEPRNATLAALGLASLGLLSGSLDAIAPVITSCFLLTYLAVNGVVFLEQRLAMISFRPTFAVPRWIPALGMAGCVVALGLSGPVGGLEVLGVVALYGWLVSRRLETPWETVHSGLAMDAAARLALWASRLSKSERSWKPDLLVPVVDGDDFELVQGLVFGATAMKGSVKYTAVSEDPGVEGLLEREVARLRAADRFAGWHRMPAESAELGILLTMNAMQGTFFASNLLLVTDRLPESTLQALRDHGQATGIGMALLLRGPAGPPSSGKVVEVWLSDRSPDWEIGLRVVNTDLPVLLAWLLTRPSEGRIRLSTSVRDPAQEEAARAFLQTLIEQGRMPKDTEAVVRTTPFLESVGRSREVGAGADLYLFGLPEQIELKRLRAIRDAAGGPCLFLLDSGQESLLA